MPSGSSNSVHPDPPLFGVDPLDRAKVEMWNRRAELEILVPATGAFIHGHKFWEGRRRQVPDYAVLARENALERLRIWHLRQGPPGLRFFDTIVYGLLRFEI